jgi:hypothetical protein
LRLIIRDFLELYADSDKARAVFMQSMEEYQCDAEKQYKVDMDIHERHDWKDVIEIAQKVQDKYSHQRLDSPGDRIKNVARKFCDHSITLETYVGNLPGVCPFASVLCGGLKLVLGVGLLQSH